MMAAGLRLKPPGQCTEITEERSQPALTPETYSHSGSRRVQCMCVCVCVCVCVCGALPRQLAQSHHFFVGNIPDVNLERGYSQRDKRSHSHGKVL